MRISDWSSDVCSSDLPHARCYPQDAAKYFDYVLGFTDKRVIADLLSDVAPHRPLGVQLGAARQPTEMPSLRERWKFIAPTIAKADRKSVVSGQSVADRVDLCGRSIIKKKQKNT